MPLLQRFAIFLAALVAGLALQAQALSVLAAQSCLPAPGDFVVVGVSFDDPDGGLAIRAEPNRLANFVGVIPPFGTGVSIGSCTQGWCQVQYACTTGWSSLRYLSSSSAAAYRVVGVDPADPQGLNLRNGPRSAFTTRGSIPFNATNVIVHTCQFGTNGVSAWCLVTFQGNSGWVNSRYLAPQDANAPQPGPAQPPNPSPPSNPSPPTDPTTTGSIPPGCQKWPDLC